MHAYLFRIEFFPPWFFPISSEKLDILASSNLQFYIATIICELENSKIVYDPIIQAIIIWQNSSTLYLVAY